VWTGHLMIAAHPLVREEDVRALLAWPPAAAHPRLRRDDERGTGSGLTVTGSPRLHGEDWSMLRRSPRDSGPPPPARGGQKRETARATRERLTPACAGRTGSL
jgi:hypothetical protein